MPSEVKTTGGLAFELPLDDNKKVDVSKRPLSPPKSKSIPSLEEINTKLHEAELRRRSAETSMLEKLAEENARIMEAQAKVAENNNNFKSTSEKHLIEKMSKAEVNQKNLKEFTDLKFQEKNNHIKDVQQRKKEIGDGGDAQEQN